MATIPTSAQIGASLRAAAHWAARIIAYFIVASQLVWEAGYRVGRAVHRLNDWMADAIHNPGPALRRAASRAIAWADIILAEETPILTGPQLLELWGAEILPEDPAPAKRSSARRKPATARKAKAAAS